VNLLLVEASELAADNTCVLVGRRAQHLRNVLGATVGSEVRAGVVGGGVGTATVTADDDTSLIVRLDVTATARPVWPVELVLAVPRPKVLTRVIEAAASFGIARITLTNAWRVDKSYLDSPRLVPDALACAARLGAEQGATTHVPPIEVYPRFMAMLEARASKRAGGQIDDRASERASGMLDRDWQVATRLVAHPDAPPLADDVQTPCVLAVGPEGGWIQRELDTFVARGFQPVSLGPPILRVETAVAALLGQLLLVTR
jgi:RsmE family RNA methyltransferase